MEYRPYHEDEKAILEALKDMKEAGEEHTEGYYNLIAEMSPMLIAIGNHFALEKLKASKGVQIMVHALGDGAIGKSVRYIQFIRDWAKKTSKTDEITIEDYESIIFPNELIPILSERELMRMDSFIYKGYEIRKSMGNGRGYNGNQKQAHIMCANQAEKVTSSKRSFLTRW